MPHRFHFDPDILNTLAGGKSAIDIPKLNIRNLEAAKSFVQSYGFDLSEHKNVEKLWYYHRRALVLLTEKLGFKLSEIPETVRDPKLLQDISHLLVYASSQRRSETDLQKWSCALLRCMHVFVHAESDLFSSFSHEIQSQILAPFQKSIFHGGNTHSTYLKSQDNHHPQVELLGFEVKPFKTSTSTVIKLLAKPDALAMKVFDKLGVRFITKSVFDSFQVLRFLVAENLISYPHIMPDQSSNNLYPVDLFLSICDKFSRGNSDIKSDEINLSFEKELNRAGEGAKFFRKSNEQSSQKFRFIKFITRKLIHIRPEGKEAFSFFYPFEVQVMDESSYKAMSTGPTEHQAYKDRQIETARKRLFPEGTV